jgi:perosamine synthetase
MGEIRAIPLSSQDITNLEIERVVSVLKSPILSRGPQLKEFEERIASYVGVPYAIAVNSGTSALHLAVKSLGLKEGDEVITTPLSFIASTSCLMMERVTPVYSDVDPETGNLDPSKIEEKITPKTKAILVVDYFGYPCDMDRITEIAKKHNLFVIEDSCEAIGAEYKGERVGRKADVATFAFFPNKQITTGEGGMIITSNEKIAKLCQSLRHHGSADYGWSIIERVGYNYWINELNCALGCTQMQRIDEILLKRQSVAEMYKDKLKGITGVRLPPELPDINVSWYIFFIQVDQRIRNDLIKYLKEKGISSREYFPCIHTQPFYKEEFGFTGGEFPNAEKFSSETIALPFYTNLKEEDIDYVVKNLKEGLEYLNARKL